MSILSYHHLPFPVLSVVCRCSISIIICLNLSLRNQLVPKMLHFLCCCEPAFKTSLVVKWSTCDQFSSNYTEFVFCFSIYLKQEDFFFWQRVASLKFSKKKRNLGVTVLSPNVLCTLLPHHFCNNIVLFPPQDIFVLPTRTSMVM